MTPTYSSLLAGAKNKLAADPRLVQQCIDVHRFLSGSAGTKAPLNRTKPQYPSSPRPSTESAETPAQSSGEVEEESTVLEEEKADERSRVLQSLILQVWTEVNEEQLKNIRDAFRARIAIRRFQRLVRARAHRKNIAQEILGTETIYVKHLESVIKLYIQPLKEAINQKTPIISKDDMRSVFSDWEIICGYNRSLLEMLTSRVEDWSPNQLLGDVFLMITTFLKAYTSYVNNYGRAIKTLYALRQSNEAFNNFIREKEKGAHSLTTYLIMPIQRIPRYELLVNELRKKTNKDHKDYNNLVAAAEKIHEVAQFIDLKKKQAESIAKMFEIQTSMPKLSINLAQPHRRFVWSAGVTLNGNLKKPVEMFLFNDLFILATLSKNDKQGRKVYKPIHTVFLQNIVEFRFEAMEYGFADQMTFELVLDSGEVFRFSTKDQHDKEKWNRKFMKINAQNNAQNDRFAKVGGGNLTSALGLGLQSLSSPPPLEASSSSSNSPQAVRAIRRILGVFNNNASRDAPKNSGSLSDRTPHKDTVEAPPGSTTSSEILATTDGTAESSPKSPAQRGSYLLRGFLNTFSRKEGAEASKRMSTLDESEIGARENPNKSPGSLLRRMRRRSSEAVLETVYSPVTSSRSTPANAGSTVNSSPVTDAATSTT